MFDYKEVKVTFVRDRFGKPMAMVDFPGLMCDCSLAELRAMARVLNAAADEAEQKLVLHSRKEKIYPLKDFFLDDSIMSSV